MSALLWMVSLYSVAQATDWRGLDAAVQEELVSESRVALVVGNGSYEAGPLANPTRDAEAMGRLLASLGFDTEVKLNLTHKELLTAVRDFGKRLKKGGTGLFYFAGHGLQVEGQNFMIPVDADIEDEAHVESEGVAVGRVLGRMEGAGNRLNIVILDACRNNPYQRSWRSQGQTGLAPVDAPQGTLIAFATGPGKVASDGEEEAHGTYTQALLDHIGSGLDLEDTFKAVRTQVSDATDGTQVPQEYTSVTGQFFFAIPSDDGSTPPPPERPKPDPVVAGAAEGSLDIDTGATGATGGAPQGELPPPPEKTREARWGFGIGNPFMTVFYEAPGIRALGRQGIGVFFGSGLALGSVTSHGDGIFNDAATASLVGGLRLYNRFTLADNLGFVLSVVGTQPVLFSDGQGGSFLPGIGGGVSLEADLGDVLWTEVGVMVVGDDDVWLVPTLSLGASL